jgi:dihydroorotate dehydrogenase (fumarate)
MAPVGHNGGLAITPMNLSTTYLGLKLRSPLIVGASPLCDDVDGARRLQDAGAGAIVLRSLFAEQVPAPSLAAVASGAHPFQEYADYQHAAEPYLRQVALLKQHLSIPVIASLNGHQRVAWTELAPQFARAGADAIELNFYEIVTDSNLAADAIEAEMLATVGAVAAAVNIPVAVKLSPYHSALAQLAEALEIEGAAGLVLFNRFYQPDVDVEEVKVRPVLHLSSPEELLLRLRWLAILSPRVRLSLAAGGGVHTAGDAVKAFLTGAHAVQLVSVLLRHGPHVLVTIMDGIRQWMDAHDYTSLDEFRGRLNHARSPDPGAFERANYLRVLRSRIT